MTRAFPAPFGASPQFWSAAQDDAGTWFFGNQPGVVSYDGATWRRIAPERYTAVTRAVARGADGRIYVGGRGDLGWLRPRADGGHDWVSLYDTLPEADRDFQEVFQIAAHGDAVFFMAAKKLLIWRSGRFTSLPHAVGRLESVGGTLYLHSANAPLERIEGERAVAVSSAPIFLADAVRHLAPRPDGRLLVVTVKSGMHLLDATTGALTPWPTEIDELLRTKQVYRALQLSDGSIAVAFASSGGGGLGVIDAAGKFRSYLDEAGGLPSGIVYGLAADRQGGIWACLDYGLAHLDLPSAGTLFDPVRGLERGIPTAFARHAGTLYYGTTQGLYRLAPAAAPRTNARFERIPTKGGVFALCSFGDTLHVVGDQRISELAADGRLVETIPLPELAYAVLRTQRDPDVLWVGLTTGLRVYRLGPTGWREEGPVAGIKDTVRSLEEAADGTLWASVNGKGFYRIAFAPAGSAPMTERTQVEFFGVNAGLADPPGQLRVGEVDGRPFFVAQNERTLLQFNETTRKFEPRAGHAPLPDGVTINAVAFANDGPDTWLASFVRDGVGRGKGGVVRSSATGESRALPHASFDAMNTGAQFFAESRDGRRVLWLGGDGGLMRLDVSPAAAESRPFTVQLRGGGVHAGEVLPFARNAPVFDFVAPLIQALEPLEYQTRLTGYETGWSAWKLERQRGFTNLREGAYRFEVRARDADGRISAPSALAFSILPPWWRTWWAYGGYGLGGVLTMLGFSRLRSAALRRKNAELEQTVAERTLALAEKNRELTRLHRLELDEKITAKLAAEASRLETLRYQLNPHFLLNTLTAVRSQIASGESQAEATVERLADFCRLTLGGRDPGEFSTVGAEIAVLRSYLEIEQTRLGAALRVEWEIDPACSERPLPRSLLLPLVENALKYGLATSEEEFLALRIRVRAAGDEGLELEIANTGAWVAPGSRPDLPSLGIGHDNLRERLRRHYPEYHAFTHDAGGGWVHVRIVLRSGPRWLMVDG